MENSTLPLYEVELLPVERRLGERRQRPGDRRPKGMPERRVRERRQATPELRPVQ